MYNCSTKLLLWCDGLRDDKESQKQLIKRHQPSTLKVCSQIGGSILSLEYIIITSLCTSLSITGITGITGITVIPAILNEVHNDVMMMYSKDKIHIEQPSQINEGGLF